MIIMGLTTFLQNTPDARRIFGKKELEIVSKQLAGLRLTQSEKNRLSRDIKPKFAFMQKASQFANEFSLHKNQDNNRLIAKAVTAILHDELKEEIKAILLFGSHVDFTVTHRSDIDICVVFRKHFSLKEATAFRIRVSGNLPDVIDVQVFHALPQKIKRAIALRHKVLYKASDYDNLQFTVQHIRDRDYFLRMRKNFDNETN